MAPLLNGVGGILAINHVDPVSTKAFKAANRLQVPTAEHPRFSHPMHQPETGVGHHHHDRQRLLFFLCCGPHGIHPFQARQRSGGTSRATGGGDHFP